MTHAAQRAQTSADLGTWGSVGPGSPCDVAMTEQGQMVLLSPPQGFGRLGQEAAGQENVCCHFRFAEVPEAGGLGRRMSGSEHAACCDWVSGAVRGQLNTGRGPGSQEAAGFSLFFKGSPFCL